MEDKSEQDFINGLKVVVDALADILEEDLRQIKRLEKEIFGKEDE